MYDYSAALPRVLQVDRDARTAAGCRSCRSSSQRWGARRTPTGKVVWCEQHVPEEILELAGAVQASDDPTPITILESFEMDPEATGPMPALEDTGPMPVIS